MLGSRGGLGLASATLVLFGGCGGNGGEVPAGFDGGAGIDSADPPQRLSLADTGLYSDFASETLADGVRPYTPRFRLWSDTATKRRWIYLPEGAVIDTSNMDAWQMPVGTKLWKEFTRDGVRVETRLIERTEGFWELTTFIWNEDQTDALEIEGFSPVENVNGTDHDVPGRDQCNSCHGRVDHTILGFGAVQLDYEPTDNTHINLDDLVGEALLSVEPSDAMGLGVPYYVIPSRNDNELAALGYLHVNCGNCHNDLGEGVLDGEMDFFIDWGTGNVDDLGALSTSGVIGVAANKTVPQYPAADMRIDPGSPATSQVWARMQEDVRGTQNQMPQLGTEDPDPTGIATLAAWITFLGPI